MLANDKKEAFELRRNLVEYLASFENGDAVRKIKERREMESDHAFLGDEQFEKFVEEGGFKSNPVLDALKASRSAANSQDNIVGRRDKKKPLDLESIAGLLSKDF